MQLGQTLMSDELPNTSRWSSGKEPSLSSDSGYGSIGMNEGGIEACQSINEGVALPSQGLFALDRKVIRLKIFDREIPQSVRYRFSDLHELFEMPLYEYLTKAKVKPSGHAMKLKVMGENAEKAKPWILVLSCELASKRIRKFFNQTQIKIEYQPSNSDMPSFQVYVCNRAPRAMAAEVDVYADWQDSSLLCGQMIRIGQHDPRIATLGGVIKVFSSDASSKLYGVTAGHTIAKDPSPEDSIPESDEEEESSEDEQSLLDENELELDIAFDEDHDVQDIGTELTTPSDWKATRHGGPWPLIGHISVTSDSTAGPDLDWALIGFDDVAAQSPSNLFSIASTSPYFSHQLRPLACEPMVDDPDRDVVLISGLGGKLGKLSTSASYLNMGRSKKSTETYTLTLRRSSVLSPGDCGSWVVDKETCEVYGHVVAVDALGEAYIVPFNATLRDIQRRLAAKSVSLPIKADLQHPYKSQEAPISSGEVSLPPPGQKSPAPPAPSLPNSFENPAVLGRLKADVDQLQLDRSPSLYRVEHQHLLAPPPQESSNLIDKDESCLGNGNLSRSTSRRNSRARRRAEEANHWLEGYTFVVEPAITIRQKDAWARTRRTTMIASQASLSQQLDKQQTGGELALQQYDALRTEGSRRGQIDQLLEKRNSMDPRFEYQLGSIRLNRRSVSSGNMEVHSMQVILKRRLRQGCSADVPKDIATIATLPMLMSEIVDLAGYHEARKYQHASVIELPDDIRLLLSRRDSSTCRDSRSRSADIYNERQHPGKSQASNPDRESHDSGYATTEGASRQDSMSSSYYDPKRAYIARPSFSPPYLYEQAAPRPRRDCYESRPVNRTHEGGDRFWDPHHARPQSRRREKRYDTSPSSSSKSSQDESDLFSQRTNSTRPTESGGSRTYDDVASIAASHKSRSRSSDPRVAGPPAVRQRRSPSPQLSTHPNRYANVRHPISGREDSVKRYRDPRDIRPRHRDRTPSDDYFPQSRRRHFSLDDRERERESRMFF